MKTFTQPMQGLKEFEDLEAALPKLSGVIQISGCIDAAKPHMMYSIGNGSGNRIIVTFQEQKAKELAEEYRFFDPNVAYYPAKDILFYQSDIRGNVLTCLLYTSQFNRQRMHRQQQGGEFDPVQEGICREELCD